MSKICLAIGLVLAGNGSCLTVQAQDASPLHLQIDKLVGKRAGGSLVSTTSDAEFVRRVYLDLAGRIPTADEARAFLDDASSEKRVILIDKLLGSDEYPRRMQQLFHVMLMERRGNHDEWSAFLLRSFQENRPWNEMARDMLNPDPGNEATRGSAYFITSRLEKYGQNPTDYPGLVRDVGRLFLGVDVQCAQCHDHLFVEDYNQVDYQGLYAFVSTAFIRRDTDFPAVGENPLKGKLEFASVFDMEKQATGPRLPGDTELEVPNFKRGEEYSQPPDKKSRHPGVLKFSPLQKLAETLPQKDNPAFGRNIANRLWWALLGRGLVEPLDLHHSDNPPTHPELLDLLATELAAHDFDMKWLVRQIVLSDTYQRSGLHPAGLQRESSAAESYQVALQRPLSAEQLLDSVLVATGHWSSADAADPDANRDAEYQAHLDRFRKALANPPREPEVAFNPSVKAALFLMNDAENLSWLKAQDENLMARLEHTMAPASVAEQLYLAVLSRRPTPEEVDGVSEYLTSTTRPRGEALANLAWALLASTEFSLNH